MPKLFGLTTESDWLTWRTGFHRKGVSLTSSESPTRPQAGLCRVILRNQRKYSSAAGD